MRTSLVMLVLILLPACGQGAPAASGGEVRTLDRATVTDLPGGDGPILCTGPIRESAPPQCEGPLITNWDWDKVWGAASVAGAHFGDFCFEGKDVGDHLELTKLPRPVGSCDAQEYLGSGTVLENRDHGPQLCLGAVIESYPVQCGGPDIPNWNWDRTPPATAVNKSKDGSYVVHGTYVGGKFTLTRPPVPRNKFTGQIPTSGPPDRDFTTSCPEPATGWFPKDRPRLAENAVDAGARFAEKIPGYSELWLDQSRNEGTENDPNGIILNVRVTKDVKGAQAAMRTVWEGALCVTEAKHTDAELRKIQDEAFALAKGLMLGSSSGDDRVDIEVIVDEGGTLQQAFDDAYGKGTVRVTSALAIAEPGV